MHKAIIITTSWPHPQTWHTQTCTNSPRVRPHHLTQWWDAIIMMLHLNSCTRPAMHSRNICYSCTLMQLASEWLRSHTQHGLLLYVQMQSNTYLHTWIQELGCIRAALHCSHVSAQILDNDAATFVSKQDYSRTYFSCIFSVSLTGSEVFSSDSPSMFACYDIHFVRRLNWILTCMEE